jgi:hypothetical protein
VAVAAANLSLGAQTNIVINDHVQYTPGSNAGLLAIAEDDVDVGLVVPDDMRVDGIYVAQNGRFGRNHYYAGYLSGSLSPYVLRNSLTRYGSVISNGRVGTKWTSSGSIVSGFSIRVTSFDQNQVDDPPPLIPETSDVYRLDGWKQEG